MIVRGSLEARKQRQRGDWTELINQKAFIVRSPRRCSRVPVRFSATPTSTTFCSARWSRKSQTESIPIHQVDRPRASVQGTEIWPACSKQQYVTLQGRAPAPS